MRGIEELVAEGRDVLESGIEQTAVEKLTELGFLVLKVGRDGYPDRLVILGAGRHVWLEFKKRNGGRLTPAQKRRFPQLAERGERVELVKSTEQAIAAVQSELRRRS